MGRKRFISFFIAILFIFGFTTKSEAFVISKTRHRTPSYTVQTPKVDPIDTYMKDIERRIESNWIPPESNFRFTNWIPPESNFRFKTVVSFQVLRDGSIRNSKISQTSGDRDFDLGAMRALASSKLSPLPNNILGDSIDITFTFERVSYLAKKDRYDR